eukprot:1527078-Rhodomonas_salina.3
MSDEEDPRIKQLADFIKEGKPPAETATFLHEKLGAKDAQVLGALCFNEPFAKAHFLLSATLGGGGKLTEELGPHACPPCRWRMDRSSLQGSDSRLLSAVDCCEGRLQGVLPDARGTNDASVGIGVVHYDSKTQWTQENGRHFALSLGERCTRRPQSFPLAMAVAMCMTMSCLLQIVHEDQMDTWHKTENMLHQFYPEFVLEDAIKARETGYKFIDWVQREDDDDAEEEED